MISYESEAFPNHTVPKNGNLITTWSELLWAAMTVGRPNRIYVFPHGKASLYEAVFRLSLVRMALEERQCNQGFYRSDAFQALDPTEKGAVSYFLGMTACKLFAYRLLDTHWLLHLDVFRGQLAPELLSGRSRPDLVGQDRNGAWHAFECKGRSNEPGMRDKRKTKAQAQRIVSVNGLNCTLHVGTMSYFRWDEWEFYWRDPASEEPEVLEPISLKLPEDEWRVYYEPALSLASVEISPSEEDPRVALDVNVEIHPDIQALLSKGDWSGARVLADELAERLSEEGFYPDGLKVVAGESWHQSDEKK